MAAKTTKIEKHNLGPRVLRMLLKEGKTSAQIAETLTREGIKISQPTVSRFIKAQRENARDEVQDILHDHVQRELPKDLTALEEMERICLAWAQEEPDTTAERVSLWQKVMEQIPVWREKIITYSDLETKDKAQVIRGFIEQVTRWLLEDINIQKQRINAMRMATSIIDTKLKYSGVLREDEGSNIIIAGQDDRQADTGESDGDGYKTLHVVGKETHGE